MQDVAVIEDAAAAEVSLDPIRARMLAELAEPHTATTLAARLGLARQKVNYHVKTLEQHGLVELVEERRKGNMTERVVQASATAYVISRPRSPRSRPIRPGRPIGCPRAGCSRSPRGDLRACPSRPVRSLVQAPGMPDPGVTGSRRRGCQRGAPFLGSVGGNVGSCFSAAAA